MLSKAEIEKVNKILSCDNCPSSYACEGCDITWTDKNLIKKYIDEIEGYLERISKQLDNVAIDQIPIAIRELQQENVALKKGQNSLMSSRKKWKHRYYKQRKKLKKQNKVIDEMVDCIWNYDICDYEITDNTYRKCEYITDDEEKPCKQCVKQYFAKKVEEN